MIYGTCNFFNSSVQGGSNWGAKEAPLSGQGTAEEISAFTDDNKPHQLLNSSQTHLYKTVNLRDLQDFLRRMNS